MTNEPTLNVIPATLHAAFADPARVGEVDPSAYYFRTTPTFETGAAAYAWLNRIVAVGVGYRTGRGVNYRIYEVA